MAFTGIFCLSWYLLGISYHLRSSLIRETATVILLSAAGLEKIFPSFVLSFRGYQPVDLSSCCSEQLHLQHQFIFMAASSSSWAFVGMFQHPLLQHLVSSVILLVPNSQFRPL